jgi:glycosyltransferase involved in cell wall biosynthesis
MISLITASLNAGPTIEAAIASAAKQGVPVQHIVIDGGSDDRTIEICQTNPHVDLRVVPGCSIYEAWNIGIECATGDLVMFLNADDELAVDSLKTVSAAFAKDNPTVAPIFIDAAALNFSGLTIGGPAINAMAFRRALFQRSGEFPISYRLAGDRAFLLRLALMPIPPRMARTDALLYEYKSHSGSLTLHKSLTQRLRIAREHRVLAAELLQARPPASVSRILHRWRRREGAAAAYHALRNFRLLTALNFMMRT